MNYFLIAAILWWQLTANLPAAIIHVSPQGTAQAPYDHPEIGFPTIAAAIAHSASGDTIMIDRGVYAERLGIAKSLTLIGAGGTATMIDANRLGSCLTVSANAQVTIEALSLRNGQSDYGGGLNLIGGAAMLKNIRISDCQAGRGGGVYAESATFAMSKSLISHCAARTSLGTNAGKGGGMYFVSTPGTTPVTIDDVTFIGNRAYLGGVLRFWDARVVLQRCQFFHNRAVEDVVEANEFSQADFVDCLLHHNQSLEQSLLTYLNDSHGTLCYLTVADNQSVAKGPMMYTDVFANIEWWNSAWQRNAPDTMSVNPAIRFAGSVFSTLPSGVTSITPRTADFTVGDDGSYYLAPAPAAPTAFIGAGATGAPYTVDDLTRKCFVSGPAAATPPNAGYAYPLNSAGMVEIGASPSWRLAVTGLSYLDYFLEEADKADFASNVVSTQIGPLLHRAEVLAVTAPSGRAHFYRLHGMAPTAYTVTVNVRNAAQTALANISVDLIVESDLSWAASAVTDIGGVARFTNIPADSYTLQAGVGSLEYVPLYMGNTTAIDDNTQFFTLSAAQPAFTTTFTLAAGSRISGLVRTTSFVAISGATVSVLTTAGIAVKTGTTNSSGSYSIGGLAAGSYKVVAEKSPTHAALYYNNRDDLTAANTVAANGSASQNLTNVNFVLTANGQVTGTISVPAGDVKVYQQLAVLYNASFTEVDSTYVDSNGFYRLYSQAGNYTVSAGEEGIYVVEYSDTITLTAGQTVANVNFSLNAGGTISGTILENVQGVPVVDVYVDFYWRNTSGVFAYVDSTLTDTDGVYLSPNLPGGVYKIFASGEAQTGVTTHTSLWYNNRADQASADLVTLVEGDDVVDIDFILRQIL